MAPCRSPLAEALPADLAAGNIPSCVLFVLGEPATGFLSQAATLPEDAKRNGNACDCLFGGKLLV